MKKILLLTVITLLNVIAFAQLEDYTVGARTYQKVLKLNSGQYYNGIIKGSTIMDAIIDITNQSDAYDNALEVAINGIAFTKAAIGSDTNHLTHTISTDTQLIQNVIVSKEYYFPLTPNIVRLKVKIENPTSSAINLYVNISSELGSDGDTKLDSSSSANDSLVNSDRWMITSDGYSDTIPQGDPVNTWVRFGSGTIQAYPLFKYKPEDGDDVYDDSIPVTIPANSYIYIVLFNKLDSTVVTAKANVGIFNNIEAMINDSLFIGIDDYSKVVNWNIVPKPTLASTGINFTNLNKNSVTINWTKGNGIKRLVVIHELVAVNADPLDDSTYSASSIFGIGAQIGTGNFVVFNSDSNSINITGLTKNTQYFVKVFEYNSGLNSTVYLTAATLSGNVTTLNDVSVSESIDNNIVSISPNPNVGYVKIWNIKNVHEICIYNIVGQLVRVIPVNVDANTQQLYIEDLEKGVYFLQLKRNNKADIIKKMIKN